MSAYSERKLIDDDYQEKFGLSREDLLKVIIRYLAFKHPGETVEPDEFTSEVNRIHRALWDGKMELEEVLPV